MPGHMTLLPSSSETGAGASEPGSARFPRHMREYLDEHHVNTSLLTALKQLLREQPARAIPRLAYAAPQLTRPMNNTDQSVRGGAAGRYCSRNTPRTKEKVEHRMTWRTPQVR